VYLTIPAIAEAYARRSNEFEGKLEMLFKKGGVPFALAEKVPGKGKKGKTAGLIFYWLVKSATIGPHPDMLPTMDEITEAAMKSINDLVVKEGTT
jgi:hypothetical protein